MSPTHSSVIGCATRAGAAGGSVCPLPEPDPLWPDCPAIDVSATCVEPPLWLAQPTIVPSTSELNAIRNRIVHVVRAWYRACIAWTISGAAADQTLGRRGKKRRRSDSHLPKGPHPAGPR